MSNGLRKCATDGTTYKYCTKCKDRDSIEYWRLVYCCENCRNIYNLCRLYQDNGINASDAYKELMTYDLSNSDNFNTNVVKPMMEEILEKGKPTQRKKQTKKTTAKADNK